MKMSLYAHDYFVTAILHDKHWRKKLRVEN